MRILSTYLINRPLNKFNIKHASDIVFAHISELDHIIQEKQPFKLIKTNKEEGIKIIEDLVVRLYTIARMLNPIMPQTSVKIKELIKSNKSPKSPLFLRK